MMCKMLNLGMFCVCSASLWGAQLPQGSILPSYRAYEMPKTAVLSPFKLPSLEELTDTEIVNENAFLNYLNTIVCGFIESEVLGKCMLYVRGREQPLRVNENIALDNAEGTSKGVINLKLKEIKNNTAVFVFEDKELQLPLLPNTAKSGRIGIERCVTKAVIVDSNGWAIAPIGQLTEGNGELVTYIGETEFACQLVTQLKEYDLALLKVHNGFSGIRLPFIPLQESPVKEGDTFGAQECFGQGFTKKQFWDGKALQPQVLQETGSLLLNDKSQVAFLRTTQLLEATKIRALLWQFLPQQAAIPNIKDNPAIPQEACIHIYRR